MSISESLYPVCVMVFGHAHPLTHRFVDRDMFMRYRGGGIGHKYMRVIEERYENMSRERIHHKEYRRRGARSGEEVSMDLDDANDGDGGGEGNRPGSQASHDTRPGEQGENRTTQPGDAADNDDEEEEDDDDYNPDSDELCSSGISDSEDLDSDEDYGGYEDYGMGDL